MKQAKFLLLGLLTFSIMACTNRDTKNDDTQNTIAAMTLEQKAQLVIGTGMNMAMPDSVLERMPPAFRGVNFNGSPYSEMVKNIRNYLPGCAGISAEFPDLGITAQTLTDGPAGLRISPTREGSEDTYYCTAFPIATVLASTWDTELVEKVGRAMGEEVLEYGGDIILGPGMNLQRDPLCGRNFEYYSEDPLITGKMAAAMVNGIQSNEVGTSIKHYAANNQETNRLSVNTIVSERALRELYLRGFEIAVKESNPWTVMSSYNKINDTYTSESYDLLTRILRDDWGFEGYVMTDWGGGSDPIAQMKAGNDMIQPGSESLIESIITAVKNSELDEAVLDRNIERILKIMKKTPRYRGYEVSNKPDLEGHAEVTRQVASDGMVLLENKSNTLPIAENVKMVAAFGSTSYDFISGGTGSGDVNEAYTISLIQGLKNSGFEVDAGLQEMYEKHINDFRANHKPQGLAALIGGNIPVEEMDLGPEIVRNMAEKADIALVTIGRNAGEGGDRQAVPGDFYLTDTEKELIKTVTDIFHEKGKKAVVVLNIAGVVETESWKNIPDAILCAWLPGQEAGNSVVDVLTGKVNPSGKLAVSFPKSYNDASTSAFFPGYAVESQEVDGKEDVSGFSFMGREPWEVVYQEDIYVGYRYYNTFEVPVSYPFGYGKSFTTFEYSNLQLSSEAFTGEITVTIDVKNSGNIAGREVVQIYVGAPDGKLEKPREVLAAFGKSRLLDPGESTTLTLKFGTAEIASFDETTSSWVVEAGEYKVLAGASATEIKGTKTFTVAVDIDGGKVSKALQPNREFDRLSKN